jgi:hypothetical protein
MGKEKHFVHSISLQAQLLWSRSAQSERFFPSNHQ